MPVSLKKGAKGPDVEPVHQALIEAGYSVAAEELDAKLFGASTDLALRDFQGHHVDQDGKPLTVDGSVGPKTLWALEHPNAKGTAYPIPVTWKFDREGCPPTLVSVCEAAVEDIGLHEEPDGSNNGLSLKKFQTYGRPWCALAVSYWYSKYAGGSPFGIRASVYSIRDWALPRKAVLAPETPALPGDLMIVLRAGGRGHVGLVVGAKGDLLSTVEGNASNAVRALVRDRKKVSLLARPTLWKGKK